MWIWIVFTFLELKNTCKALKNNMWSFKGRRLYILGAIGRAMLGKVWQTPMEHQMDHQVNPLEVDHQVGPHEEVHQVGHLMDL
jgi:hypothetical protein